MLLRICENIDKAQNRFLRELGITTEHAFMEYVFVPPSLRRIIGVLGFPHKRVLRKCLPSTAILWPFWPTQPEEIRPRGHTKKLYGHFVEIRYRRAIYDWSFCDD